MKAQRPAVRRALRTAAAAIPAVPLLAAVFGSRTIPPLEGAAGFLRGSLGGALEARHGVVFCCGMDGRLPADAVSGAPLSGAGSRS
ncbi:MAG: hypothetical protein IJ783_00470, partial [Kiritimatiellae bacterium]|nr:hypothetical protein [Kiritimatiellia bacterium]